MSSHEGEGGSQERRPRAMATDVVLVSEFYDDDGCEFRRESVVVS